MSERHLHCIGLGYSARVLCQRLHQLGWSISGSARSSEGTKRIEACGWKSVVFDGATVSPLMSEQLASATHVLLSVPPDETGDPALRWHATDLAAAPRLEWIGYLSTVGVYGDNYGGWVDEATPAAPSSIRGKRRLAAESAWLAHGAAAAKRVEIFRLPGIYGPGRSAIDAMRAGTARRIIKPGQVFNRIHVSDIATALQAAIFRPTAFNTYNVTDDEPSSPEDVVTYAAMLLGLPPPPAVPFATAELSPMARSFYGESKRVSNARMKRELGVELAFPSFREGLTACLMA